MRTITDATLYTVTGPRGTYYALRDHDSGTILTERTPSAAIALANEKDLIVVERLEIEHAELLEMVSTQYADGSAAAPDVPPELAMAGDALPHSSHIASAAAAPIA